MKDDLISRQMAKEAILKHGGIMFIPDKKFVAEALARVPTVDAVELILCKDCKHNTQNGGDCNRTLPITSRNYITETNETAYIKLNTCSYGERRADP